MNWGVPTSAGKFGGASGGLGVGVRAREGGFHRRRWLTTTGKDGEGQRGGSAFIGGQLRHERKGSRAGSAPSKRAPVAFHRCCAMVGQKKEGEHRGRKVDDAADEWVQTHSERTAHAA